MMPRTSAEARIVEALSPDGRALFEARLIRKPISARRIIIDKGDRVSGAYFVLEGALRVFSLGANGRETTLYRIEPGGTCVLALNALFNDLLYPAWVEADIDSLIGILPGRISRSLFSGEAVIQNLTVQALSSAVFGLMTAVEDRAGQSVVQRLAGCLLLQARADGTIRLTQQALAAQLGTTREVVGRHMARFAAKGLLKSRRGHVTLLDVAGLRRIQSSDGTGSEA